MTEQFDREYYQRFYFNPRTAVTSRAEMNARGRLIAAMADHLGLPVRSILDAGCGVGLLRTPLRRGLPKATYTGLEVSEYDQMRGKFAIDVARLGRAQHFEQSVLRSI